MEQNETWEQPTQSDNVPVADAKIDESTPSSEDGSQFGKFKDAESLLSAYNNLQAEFTRKCQKLSEIEKQQQKSMESEASPVFSQEDWQDKVSQFLSKNQDAKKFASEISQEIMSNPELSTSKDALSLAWANVMSKKYKPMEDMINDDKFVNDYVLSNEQIKQKVLSMYVKDIENKKIPPIVTASSGGNIAFPTTKKANTLNEAKSLVEAIFNIKGK